MKYFFTFIGIACLIGASLAQGVGINATGAGPDPSAILDASSTSRGFLPPRMTTQQRDSIQNPALGLQLFNITTNCLEIYIAPNWQNIFCGCTSAPASLSYTDNGPLSYCLNTGITPNNATTQASTPSSFIVSPSLPAGLQLNNVNGQITGTPLALSTATNYTITASNACGSTAHIMNIEVIGIPDTPSVISGPSAPTINTTVNYSILAAAGASSYTWTVPVGWTINSGQGTTTINITAGTNAGNITVTATNSCGTSFPATKAVTSWRPIAASGGTITNYTANGSNGVNGVQYRVHRFATVGNSSFIVNDAGTDSLVDYLIVAGGGGGGSRHGGGGGAGGMLTGIYSVFSNSFNVVVGGGGAGGIANSSLPASGGNSSLFGFTANGGGGAGQYSETNSIRRDNGLPGGSGGGGANNVGTAGQGGQGNLGQGNNGGSVISSGAPWAGAGGGGAGTAGGNSPNPSVSGAGGAGLSSSINGTPIHYAGGGGGAGNDVNGTGGSGGIGGGGTGGGDNQPGNNGTNGLGGGGGGARASSCYTCAPGGSGGSGIVIIRYPLSNPNP
jgi:hypothetical protein